MENSKKQIKDLLALADIRLNGQRPWDIRVHDDRFYHRVLAGGSLGLGESYMDGWWDAQDLEKFFYHIHTARLAEKVRPGVTLAKNILIAKMLNNQSITRSYRHIGRHYDIGHDLYEAMLDSRLTYSCGYWQNAKNLDQAQEAKLDLICRKIGLKKGMTVLDIGCGWGSFIKYAAQKYGAKTTGITLSQDQYDFVKKDTAGLPVKVYKKDYREFKAKKFDRVVSVGMFEHVGPKNYQAFMKKAHELLKPDGLFLLHTIGGNRSVTGNDPWINKYIFPGAVMPSAAQVARAAENIFTIEDLHNFGPDYAKTLRAWWRNFNKDYPKLKHNYDERFYRMWKFYLLGCAAIFEARQLQLWQVVFSIEGSTGTYLPVR